MCGLQLLTSKINDTFIPSQILEHYYDLEDKIETKHTWQNMPEEKIWQELCFCILSGNVAFELAKSVIQVMTENGFLDYKWILQNEDSTTVLVSELNKPSFQPIRNNGKLRKYRYPVKRGNEISAAAKAIYSKQTIKEILRNEESEIAVRDFFVNNISGLGIKEASHFLRNIGYSDSLAIIDIHVFRFLRELLLVDFTNSSLTMNRYLKLEKILRNFAEYHGLNLAILDLAIWHYMRNRL